MNIFKKFITIFIVLFLFAPSAYGEDKIVYLDLDNVVTNTNAGKSILDQLEKSKKSALLRFEKKEKELKIIEDEIKKQKNIISEEELRKKLLGPIKGLSPLQNKVKPFSSAGALSTDLLFSGVQEISKMSNKYKYKVFTK